MTQHLSQIMQKEMNRKEFLGVLGFGLLSVLGFSNIIQLLTGKSMGSLHGASQKLGYGSSAYGGSSVSK